MSRLRILAAIALAVMQASALAWERIPPLPEANAGFLCGTIGDSVVIAGGTNWTEEAKHWLSRIWIFDPARNAWREAGALASPLAYGAFGVTSEGLWFAGGSTGEQTSHSLSRIDRTFTVRHVADIDPRVVYSASALMEGKLYVFGGAQEQAKIEILSNAAYSIELATGMTTRLPDVPGPGFMIGAAAACAGRIFLFGGGRWNQDAEGITNLAASFVFSPAENRWKDLPALPSENRGLTAIAIDGDHLLIAGGYKNDVEEFTDEAFIFDTRRGEFRATKPLPHRALVALVKCGEFLYCLGGEDRKKHRTDACFRILIADLLK